ncbi:MAG: methyltransferase domain-containing protein [Saprospiraceae bacterium]|nr:methyltransferase domain-containing protein [Saprospiraceae bacterium]
MKHLDFLKESFKNIRTTGAVARSSKYLVREMMQPIHFADAKIIVELGAGDGVLTIELLSRMAADARLLCFEINPEFCKILRGAIDDPRFVLIEDSAENLEQYLQEWGFEKADYIISAIPFIALPNELVYRIVSVCHKVLKNKGLFIQFHYSSFIQKMYRKFFDHVEVEFVPLNIPPAFVMICEKNS